MTIITSTSNPVIKEIKALRQRKTREETRQFYIEGLRIVIQSIQEAKKLDMLIWSPELLISEIGKKVVHDQIGQNTTVIEVSAPVFKSLSQKDGPQGIAAILKQEYRDLKTTSVNKDAVFIGLDAVQDPGNLGTILRTADATGCDGIILLENSTDAYDPGAVRASMGAIFTQCIIRSNLKEFAMWKKQNRIMIYGTSGDALFDFHETQYTQPMVLLMGSERQGLRTELLDLCDNLVKIPMLGRCDSLNLAIATGVMLYEILNQHRDVIKRGPIT
jgi:TrmH family RNA methyltransferase